MSVRSSGDATVPRRHYRDGCLFDRRRDVFTEIVVAGLSVQQSLYARLTALPIILITARPYGLYRDWICRRCRAEEGVARRLIADTAALISFQLPVYWITLAAVGATLWQIAAASVTAIVILSVSGRPFGAMLDLFRRLFGVTQPEAQLRAQLSACDSRARIVRSA